MNTAWKRILAGEPGDRWSSTQNTEPHRRGWNTPSGEIPHLQTRLFFITDHFTQVRSKSVFFKMLYSTFKDLNKQTVNLVKENFVKQLV